MGVILKPLNSNIIRMKRTIIKRQNIIRRCLILIIAFAFPLLSSAKTVKLFCDAGVPQISFAANDIKNALQLKGFTVEVLPL